MRERAQASAELLAVIPLVLIAALGLAQLAIAGWALMSAGEAARAGARIVHLDADPGRAVRAALPDPLEPARLHSDHAEVTVQVRAPALLPGIPEIPVSASAALDPAAAP